MHVTLYTVDHGQQAVEARIEMADDGTISVTSPRPGHADVLHSMWAQWGIRDEGGQRVFPRDGRRFLDALPREYRSHYKWASDTEP